MSAHNLALQLSEILETAEGFSIGNQSKGGVIFAVGAAVPTDATAGYRKGCVFVDTSGTNPVTVLFVNVGSLTSCNFDPVGGM